MEARERAGIVVRAVALIAVETLCVQQYWLAVGAALWSSIALARGKPAHERS